MTSKMIKPKPSTETSYGIILSDIASMIFAARHTAARSVNCVMTATYWLIGRRIVEFEQKGETRAAYGIALLKRLSEDLSKQFGQGFGVDNLQRFRAFYLSHRNLEIYATVSRTSADGDLPQNYATLSRKFCLSSTNRADKILQTPSAESRQGAIELFLKSASRHFPLPWSAYVRLLAVKNECARRFYESEALRGGWSVRQLDRQINSQFYERTALSKNRYAMLAKGQMALPEDRISPEEEIKDPYVLEFLDLRDEYSETDLEEALIRRLETFLLELGGDFCFVGRQKRLRIGEEWYRVDLVFFHRRLRCLVIVDLKIGKFTHADAGQMHLYLNYAEEHWTREGENPPVGLILCAQKDEAVARYALDRLPNKVLAAEYHTALPDEEELAAEIERAQAALEQRKKIHCKKTVKKHGYDSKRM